MSIYDEQKTFGYLVPDVIFDKVVLEASGIPPKLEGEPHIADPYDDAPVKTIDDINQTLHITVQLMVQDQIDNNLIGSWFEDEKYRKFVKIKLIQITKPRLASRMLDLDRKNYHQWFTNHLTRAAASIPNQVSIKDLSLDQPRGEVNFPQLGKYYKTFDSQGNEYFNVPFVEKFTLKKRNPDYLSYLTLMYIDLEAFKKSVDDKFDPELIIDEREMSLLYGRLSNVIVIEDGQLVSKSFKFFKDGEEWKGPVHKMTDTRGNLKGWMDGFEHAEHPFQEYLDYIPTRVDIIQDFRDVDELNRFKIDLSFIESDLAPEIKKLDGENTDIAKKVPYLTDFWLTKDYNNSMRFIFGIELWELLEQNSVFAPFIRIFRRKQLIDPVRMTEIKSARILRRKIENIRASTGYPNSPIIIPEDLDVTELVDVGEFELITATRAGINSNSVLFYSARDDSMEKISAGKYQYTVELDFLDGTFKYLEGLLSALRTGKKATLEYYNIASKVGLMRETGLVDEPHIVDPITRQTQTNAQEIKGNYDPIANRFTVHAQNKLSTMEWNVHNAIENYMVVISNLSTQLEQSDLEYNRIFFTLKDIVSLKNGNPRGILAVIKLMGDLISNLENLLSIAHLPALSRSELSGQKERTKSSAVSRIFSIRKEFTQVANISEEKNMGYNFLDIPKSANNLSGKGLRTISGDYYIDRVQGETLRFFRGLNENISIVFADGTIPNPGDSLKKTAFSFLTPFSLKIFKDEFSFAMPDKNTNTIKTIWNNKKFTEKETEVLVINEEGFETNPEKVAGFLLGGGPGYGPTGPQKSEFNILINGTNFAANKNLTISKVRVEPPFEKSFTLAELDSSQSEKLLFENWKYHPGRFSNFTSLYLSLMDGYTSEFGPISNIRTIQALDPEILVHLSGLTFSNDFSVYPNFFKALLLCFSRSTSSNPILKNWIDEVIDPFKDTQSSPAMRMHAYNLSKIEFLSGFMFAHPTGKTLVKSPIWQRLQDISEFKNSAVKKIICRISPIEENFHSLPIYDKYFLLDVSDITRDFGTLIPVEPTEPETTPSDKPDGRGGRPPAGRPPLRPPPSGDPQGAPGGGVTLRRAPLPPPSGDPQGAPGGGVTFGTPSFDRPSLGTPGGTYSTPPPSTVVVKLGKDGMPDPSPDSPGCTDPSALNYDPTATIDDGTCKHGDPPEPIDTIDDLTNREIEELQLWEPKPPPGSLNDPWNNSPEYQQLFDRAMHRLTNGHQKYQGRQLLVFLLILKRRFDAGVKAIKQRYP